MLGVKLTGEDFVEATGIVGFLLLVLGYVVLMYYVISAGSFVGVIALVLSIIGLALAVKNQHRGKGFAIAGIAIGAVCLILLMVLGIVSLMT